MLTALVLVIAGAVWMLAIALFNIGVQLSAPRWVAGRALAAFQASIAGGVALGSWGWGLVANTAGVSETFLICGGVMLASPLIGFWLTMPVVADPKRRRRSACRSGSASVDHRAQRPGRDRDRVPGRAETRAREFHNLMQQVQLSRQRNGAYGWSIARDIADPELWTERYHCPTWLDYLRQRNRPTAVRARAHPERAGISHRPRAGAHPPHAGASVRIGALERRHAGPRGEGRADPGRSDQHGIVS